MKDLEDYGEEAESEDKHYNSDECSIAHKAHSVQVGGQKESLVTPGRKFMMGDLKDTLGNALSQSKKRSRQQFESQNPPGDDEQIAPRPPRKEQLRIRDMDCNRKIVFQPKIESIHSLEQIDELNDEAGNEEVEGKEREEGELD